jgi:hypothetical protein
LLPAVQGGEEVNDLPDGVFVEVSCPPPISPVQVRVLR